MVPFSRHAHIRCAQRQIHPDSVAFIKKHGQKIRRTGIIFYFLRRRDIPETLRCDDQFAKLEGATLLISQDGTLITAYRNPKGLKAILKKTPYRL